MIFVKFIIDNGGIEYFDYSWFKDYSIAHYEDSKSITDKDIIREVYGDEENGNEHFEDNFKEENNTYTYSDDDVISVHRVQEMTEKELDVLVKLGVLHRWTYLY